MRIMLSLTASLFVLSGCSSALNTAGSDSFACPGMPGVICKTPAEVYKMTNGDINDINMHPELKNKKQASAPSSTAVVVQKLSPASAELRAVDGEMNGRLPMPIRTPAIVMRIWMAPWKDANDDLHWPSYIYTEIEPRKWAYENLRFSDGGQKQAYTDGKPANQRINPATMGGAVGGAAIGGAAAGGDNGAGGSGMGGGALFGGGVSGGSAFGGGMGGGSSFGGAMPQATGLPAQ